MADSFPKWEPTPALRRAKDGFKFQNIKYVDGVKQQIPYDPFVLMLKPAGNVVMLTVASNRNIAESENVEGRRSFELSRALRQGFLPWDYEDFEGLLPQMLKLYRSGGTQYMVDLLSGIRSEEDWIKARTEIQKRRKDAHTAATAEQDRAFNADQEARKAESKASFAEAMAELATAIKSDHAAAPATKRKPKVDGNGEGSAE